MRKEVGVLVVDPRDEFWIQIPTARINVLLYNLTSK